MPKNCGGDPTPPKLPQPRMSREIFTPVEPSRVYSMRPASSVRMHADWRLSGRGKMALPMPITSMTPPATPAPRAAVTPHGLRRVLGIGFGLAVIVGSTLGIGILRTPGMVAGQLPTPSAILLVGIVGGLYTLLGAVCFAELGTMLPREGGYYVYARHAFGDTIGFAAGWADGLPYCGVPGCGSIGFGDFAAKLAPALSGGVTPIAVAALVCLVALQLA